MINTSLTSEGLKPLRDHYSRSPFRIQNSRWPRLHVHKCICVCDVRLMESLWSVTLGGPGVSAICLPRNTLVTLLNKHMQGGQRVWSKNWGEVSSWHKQIKLSGISVKHVGTRGTQHMWCGFRRSVSSLTWKNSNQEYHWSRVTNRDTQYEWDSG